MLLSRNVKYSEDHEWVRVDGNKAYIGISDFAQYNLGDIVFVEFPQKGAMLNAKDELGTVESVKAVSQIFSPVSGIVVEINEALEGAPEKINDDPYGSWIAVIEMSNPAELDSLMDDYDYEKFCDIVR